tara:strand:- start:498 stop:1376 length:879 start_codon:yes stop_codon:yes gene_type:complete
MATPGFLEEYAKDFATQAKGAYSVPIDTSQFTGRQFVAGEDPLQTQAINLATQGVGGYQPFLSAAQAAQTQAAGTVGGLGALTGANAYQPFMSPYQQNVIDTTLTEFDRSRTGDRQSIQDAAVGTGNFGGGREGAMLGEYDARTLADREALRAQMLQSGFQNAQAASQTAFTQGGQLAAAQSGLGAAQMGLSNFQRAGLGADVGALGQLGSLRQGQAQSLLSADQQAAQTAAYEPYGRLSQYGQGLTGLSGGVASQAYAQPAPVSPMSQAIGTALGVGGLYGKIFGFPGDSK